MAIKKRRKKKVAAGKGRKKVSRKKGVSRSKARSPRAKSRGVATKKRVSRAGKRTVVKKKAMGPGQGIGGPKGSKPKKP